MATLLVADDQHDLVEMMLSVFEMHGHTVLTAQDGLQAVAAVEQHSPDAVLMDIAMPNLDGVAATKRIRELPGHEQLPIIAFTGYVGRLKADAHLFTHVCVKPCRPMEVMRLAEALIGTGSGARRPQPGDLLLRRVPGRGFELIEISTGETLTASVPSLSAAIETTRTREGAALWKENVDSRGRILGEPHRLL